MPPPMPPRGRWRCAPCLAVLALLPGPLQGSPGPGTGHDGLRCTPLDSASRAELESLPGIGPAMAERLLQARQQRPFTDARDVQARVTGVGAARWARWREAGLCLANEGSGPSGAGDALPGPPEPTGRAGASGPPATLAPLRPLRPLSPRNP